MTDEERTEFEESFYRIPNEDTATDEDGLWKIRGFRADNFKKLMEYLHQHHISTGFINDDMGTVLQCLTCNMNFDMKFRIVIEHDPDKHLMDYKMYLR